MSVQTLRQSASLQFALWTCFLACAPAPSQMNPALYRPYTAVEKTMYVQGLADGTIIKREATATMVRDSRGRTLRKETLPMPGGKEITHYSVTDPDAHTLTNWTTQNKHATRIHMLVPRLSPQASLRPGIGAAVGGAVVTSPNGIAPAGPVLSGGTGVGIAGQVSDSNLKPSSKREKLEGKMIAGVNADGTRITTTFPVNSLGNDRPITIVRETWTSPDLNITLYTVTQDPRSGTQSTEVTSLERSEPDATLFDPPADYEIKDIHPSNNSGTN
jgi:hypothetical protein